MKRLLLISAFFWIVALPGRASDCSTAFVCDVVNYQRMFLDGRLLELPKQPFSFRLQGNELSPLQEASPLGDGTLGYEVNTLELCEANGKLKENSPYFTRIEDRTSLLFVSPPTQTNRYALQLGKFSES